MAVVAKRSVERDLGEVLCLGGEALEHPGGA